MLIGISFLPDLLLTGEEKDDAVLDETKRPTLIWLHAGLAVGIFILSYMLQHRVRPYVFDFQNWIEKFLLICSANVVLLASLYTLFDAKVHSSSPLTTSCLASTHPFLMIQPTYALACDRLQFSIVSAASRLS